MANLRTLVLATLVLVGLAGTARAQLVLDLVDTKGKTVSVHDASSYQKSTSYIPTKYTRFDGVEVKQGEGRVVVQWSRIDRVERKRTANGKDFSDEYTVFLLDGKQVDVTISHYAGLQYVGGKTDLGEYEVFWNDLAAAKVTSRGTGK